MNVIKTERRASMHTDTLSDLIEIHTEGASLADFFQMMQFSYGGQVVVHHIESTRLQEKPTDLECLEENRVL